MRQAAFALAVAQAQQLRLLVSPAQLKGIAFYAPSLPLFFSFFFFSLPWQVRRGIGDVDISEMAILMKDA